MSKECVCVTVDDVYGAGWLARNKEELDKRWEWEFRFVVHGELVIPQRGSSDITPGQFLHPNSANPLIICLKEKPAAPKVEDIYGCSLDELTAPDGYVFTGEFRRPEIGEYFLPEGSISSYSYAARITSKLYTFSRHPELRLILRLSPVTPPPTIESVYGTSNPVIPDGWISAGVLTGAFEVGEAWLGATCGEEGSVVTAAIRYSDPADKPRLKLRRVSLKDVYGSDEVTIPPGFEWTGEFRRSETEDAFVFKTVGGFSGPRERLILRDLTPQTVTQTDIDRLNAKEK